jgi:hypothetical protein
MPRSCSELASATRAQLTAADVAKRLRLSRSKAYVLIGGRKDPLLSGRRRNRVSEERRRSISNRRDDRPGAEPNQTQVYWRNKSTLEQTHRSEGQTPPRKPPRGIIRAFLEVFL